MQNAQINCFGTTSAPAISDLARQWVWSLYRHNPQEEYVLDYILERKRVDDLYQSIKSENRYDKQKWRMHQCGLRHLIYLVEGDPDTLDETGITFLLAVSSIIPCWTVRRCNLHCHRAAQGKIDSVHNPVFALLA